LACEGLQLAVEPAEKAEKLLSGFRRLMRGFAYLVWPNKTGPSPDMGGGWNPRPKKAI